MPWRGGFGRIWGSIAISMMGTQVSLLALPLTALAALDASPSQVALLAAAGTAPFLVLGLPAGAWVDLWSRRALMVTTDVLRGLLLASVPAAWLLGVLCLGQLYVVAFGVGSLSVLFDVASLTVLPALVPRGQIAAANGRLEAARAVAQTSGPGVGGVLVQALTAPLAVAVDAISYLASGLLLRGLPPVPAPERPAGREPLARQVTAGLAFCLRHPYIRPLALGAAWMNLWVEAFLAILVTYAVRDLDLSAATVGVVLAGSNVGYLLGSLAVPRLNRAFGIGRSIALGAGLQVGFVVATFARTGYPVLWLTLGLAISAAGTAVWNVNAVSLRQATTPSPMLARMNASNRFLIWGTMPLGAAVGAWLASSIGLADTTLVAAIAAPLSALPVVLSAVRAVRTMPEGEPSPSTPRPARGHVAHHRGGGMNGTLTTIASFTVVAALLTISPGADTLLVLTHGVRAGRRTALACAVGVNAGLVCWAVLSVAGLTALLATVPGAYRCLQLGGAVYLVGLGVSGLLRHRVTELSATRAEPTAGRQPIHAFRRGVVTNLLNPKVGIFYVSLLPQFAPADQRGPGLLLVLASIHLALSALWLGGVARASARAARSLSGTTSRRLERFGALALVGAGVAVAGGSL